MRTGTAALILVLTGCHHHSTGRTVVPVERPRLTYDDVVRMLKAGQPEQQIIGQLREAHLEPPFSAWPPGMIVDLKQVGASDTVIQEMRLASERPAVEYREQPVRVHYNHPGPLNPGE